MRDLSRAPDTYLVKNRLRKTINGKLCARSIFYNNKFNRIFKYSLQYFYGLNLKKIMSLR